MLDGLIHEFQVGEFVYIYSVSLDKVVGGIVEGFESDRKRIKVLQSLSTGTVRHTVSYVYVFYTEEEAIQSKELESKHSPVSWESGYVVHLKQKNSFVTDSEGNPYLYQIIGVYPKKSEVALVTSYGESIGRYKFQDIRLHSREPLFQSSDYDVGDEVTWIEGDDIYRGSIIRLRESTAEIANIKKLMPVDMKKNIPYYKISKESYEQNPAARRLNNIVGDTLDK